MKLLVAALLLAIPGFAQTTERVSVNSLGFECNKPCLFPSISADGRYVAFTTTSKNFIPLDGNGTDDVFVHDRVTGITTCVSVNSSGEVGNRASRFASISADGQYIAFVSWASNLLPGYTPTFSSVYVYDMQTGLVERVSDPTSGAYPNGDSTTPTLSADGRFVEFYSRSSNLVSGDTNSYGDIFVFDRQNSTTERVNLSSSGQQSNGQVVAARISEGGHFVVFESVASNLVLGDVAGTMDIFVRNLQTGVTERVSVSSNGTPANDWVDIASISADGRHVAFQSRATNLIVGDINGIQDVFAHDRQTGITTRISENPLGVSASRRSGGPRISADGRYITYSTLAGNLVPGDTNQQSDIFVYDQEFGVTERISLSSAGVEGDRLSHSPVLSSDGQFLAFASDARNLVYGDNNERLDIFVRDRWNGLGTNSLYLVAPATAQVGSTLQVSWATAKPNTQYWLAYANNRNGSVIGGHNFDLGGAVTILATGTNSAIGAGSFTSAPISAAAAGHTLYLELATQDGNGVLFDSAVRAVSIY